MPGGAKKAVFPTMAMHDHEHQHHHRGAAAERAEHRKHHLVRGKSTEGGKESPEKEKDPNAKHKSGKNPPMTKSMSGHSTDGHHHHHHHHGEGHHHHHGDGSSHHHHQEQKQQQSGQQQQSHHHHHHEHQSHGSQHHSQVQDKAKHPEHPPGHAAK